MFKYALLVGLLLPVTASAADYIVSTQHGPNCPLEQWGNRYCVQVPPVEKITTDCDPGLNCTHMQSGHHYSVQTPVNLYE